MVEFKKPSFSLVLVVFICIFIAAAGIVSASVQIPTYKNVNLSVANDDGVRFQGPNIPSGTYNFFSATQGQTQGYNALHIASDNNTPSGDVTNIDSTSGTFYLTDTGGRGWDDNGILMIAVNGTMPENFSIHITSSGYQWTPVSSGYPSQGALTYVSGSTDETFTLTDFTSSNGYYSTWKPATAPSYPIYEGQETYDDTFHIIFVDLYAGIIGEGTSYHESLRDNGALQVNYTISNLPSDSMVAFNAYAYCQSSNQGNGIRWTNSVNTIGNNSLSTSGWNVASWF